MNLFSNLEDIYRLSAGAGSFAADIRGFQRLYREMYAKLGKQGYLLGEYVSKIFEYISIPPVYSSRHEGVSSFHQLWELCYAALGGRENDHPFYSRLAEYINATPLYCQEEKIRICLYVTGLSGEMLDWAASDYRLRLRLSLKMEPSILRQSYACLAEVLGSESELKKLNGYIYRRFLPAPPVAAFIQGFTESLLKSFTAFDPETRKYCYELAWEKLNERED